MGAFMSNQQYADWSSWNKSWTELAEISKETSEKVVRECISYYSDCTATVMKYMQTVPRVTGPEDFVNTQMKVINQQNSKNLEFVQNIFNIFQESIKNNTTWTEREVSTAMKNTSKAVKKATSAGSDE